MSTTRGPFREALLITCISFLTVGLLSCGGGGGGGGGFIPPASGPQAPPTTGALQVNTGTSRAAYYNLASAFNNTGSGVMAWEEYSGNGVRVLWAYFDGTAMQPEQELAIYSSSPAVATNGTDFMLTWYQSGYIYAAPCSSSGVLGSPVMLSSSGGEVPDIAASTAGYAVAWQGYDSVSQQYRIFVNIYSASSWTTAQLVDTVSGSGFYPRIASNGSGYAIAWRKGVIGGSQETYSAVSSGNTGTATWQVSLLENLSGHTLPPSIASDGNGYAVAWAQYDGSAYSVYANVYSAGTWSTGATPLENGPYDIIYTDMREAVMIASDGNGYAVAWAQYDNAVYNIFMDLYSAGSWAVPVSVANNGTSVANVSITSRGSGYGVAWQQDEGGALGIYANLYSAGTWSATPQKLNTSPAGYQRPLAVRFPPAGGFAVGWYQNDASGNPNIYGINYTSSTGWSQASPRVQKVWRGTSFQPKMVTNRNGVSLAVWPEFYNEKLRVYGSVNGSGAWGAPFLIDGNATGDFGVATNGSSFMVLWYSITEGAPLAATCASDGTLGTRESPANASSMSHPSLASNNNGYAAVWSGWDYTGHASIFANVYSNGSWSKDGGGIPTPWVIENSTQNAFGPAIASNGSGYAAAWVQSNGSNYRVYANLFTSGTWSTGGTLLEASSGNKDADAPSIASNGSGYAAAWWEADGSGNWNRIYANVYSGGTWSTGATLLENLSGGAAPPSIASNGSGYAVSWPQYDGTTSSIYANIYSSGTWSTEGTLLENNGNWAVNPSIASDGSGYAVAWSQHNGVNIYSIYANLYSAGTWSAGGTLLETDNSYADLPMIISNGNKYSVIWLQQEPDTVTTDPLVYDIRARLGF